MGLHLLIYRLVYYVPTKFVITVITSIEIPAAGKSQKKLLHQNTRWKDPLKKGKNCEMKTLLVQVRIGKILAQLYIYCSPSKRTYYLGETELKALKA